MKYDELVKRLRTEFILPYATIKLMREAADAIEELRKAVLRLEDELGIYDDLPIVDQSMVLSKIEAEEVYDKYTDTAGNLHWTGTQSGEHKMRMVSDEQKTS